MRRKFEKWWKNFLPVRSSWRLATDPTSTQKMTILLTPFDPEVKFFYRMKQLWRMDRLDGSPSPLP
jgi:hypothetical protein